MRFYDPFFENSSEVIEEPFIENFVYLVEETMDPITPIIHTTEKDKYDDGRFRLATLSAACGSVSIGSLGTTKWESQTTAT